MRAGMRIPSFVTVVAMLWLSACGDGRGGGGGGTPAPPTLKLFTQSVSFSNNKQEFATPSPQIIRAEALNISNGAYVGVAYSSKRLSQVAYDITTNPFVIELTPKSPLEVGLKVVKDQVVIAVCEDADCKS